MSSRWAVPSDRAVWIVVGVALFAALGFVLYSFVGTFVFGIFLYYSTRPIYRRLKQRVRPPSLAAAVALLLLALPALLLLAYTLAVGLQEANRALDLVQFGSLQEMLQPYIDVSLIVQQPEQLLEEPNARAVIQEFVGNALSYLGFIGTALLHLFVVIGLAFYLLRDDQRLIGWFRSAFPGDGDLLRRYSRAVDRDFSNIFFGNILNAIITAIIGALSYNAIDVAGPATIGIPYPTLLGLLTGVASLIPVVGMKLVYFPVTLSLVFVSSQTDPELLWFPAVFAVISFVIVDTIPDLVLRPYVSGRQLHLGMVMFAYIFGPLLFGWYGIFLGPVLLVLIVHFVRIVLPELAAPAPEEEALPGSDPDTATADDAAGFEDAGFEPATDDIPDQEETEAGG
jgi:predicted PurR-regulated permease PerM